MLKHILTALLVASAAAYAGKLNVVTTTSDLASLTEAVAGDLAKVKSISSGNQDPHHLQARPKYVMMARNADLWIRTGMDLEIGWEMPVIDGSRNRKIRPGNPGHLDASTHIHKLEVPDTSLLTRAMGDVHAQGNPHYLTDPHNARHAADQIAERLGLLDPKNAEAYKNNARAFSKKIDERMAGWKQKMEPLKGKSIVTYHRSWIYFCERFGVNIAIELEPKPGVPPKQGDLTRVVKTVREKGAQAIVTARWSNDRSVRFVAEKTGIAIVELPAMVGGVSGADSWIGMMDVLHERMAAALGD